MKLHIVLHVQCQRGEKCVHAVQATVEQEGCKTDGEGGLFLLQLNVFSCTSQELNKELSGKKENGLISEASSNFLILSLSGIFMRLAWRGCFMTRIGCQELGGGDLGFALPRSALRPWPLWRAAGTAPLVLGSEQAQGPSR